MQTCPECATNVPVPDDAVEGEVLPCPSCEVELELLELEPVVLALAPEVDEDWGE